MNVLGLVRLRWLLGTLLIVAAALFAVGIAAEGDSHREPAAVVEPGVHDEAVERAEHREQSEAAETGERILGIDFEATPLVVLAVVVSVVLAAATWRTDRRRVLLATALFAAVFAVLDIAEFAHQVRRSAPMVAAIAAVIGLLHVAAAALADQRRGVTG